MAKVYHLDRKKPNRKIRVRHILLVVLALYIGYTLVYQHIAIRQARSDEAVVREQIRKLEEENERIRAQIEMMQSDQYIEKLAREKLGLIKPGEVMFVDVNRNGGNSGN
ncbi:MAG: Cell division protein DivIC (FtsB), stabilizes FtsL against RasP cleavage [Firmicutes bacterium]|nr:Cell division protein DivIC (FtsB), stabilizes FtsL against RasP cleavage [Bacillota bacterium]MDI6705084.1 septum formation initiator family protein [Bacillota bacterium]